MKNLETGSRLLDAHFRDPALISGGTFRWSAFLDRAEGSFTSSNRDTWTRLGFISQLAARANGLWASGITGGNERDPAKIAFQIANRKREPGEKDINCNSINNVLLPPLAARLGFATRRHEGLWASGFKAGQHFIRTYERDGIYAAINYDEITLLGTFQGAMNDRSLAVARAAQSTLGPGVGFYLGGQNYLTRNGTLLTKALATASTPVKGTEAEVATYGDSSSLLQLGHETFRYLRVHSEEGSLEALGASLKPTQQLSAFIGYLRMDSTSDLPFYRLESRSGNPIASPIPGRSFSTQGAVALLNYNKPLVQKPSLSSVVRASAYGYEDLQDVNNFSDFIGRAPNYGTELGLKTTLKERGVVDLYTSAFLSGSDGWGALYYTNRATLSEKTEGELKVGAVVGRPISGESTAVSPALWGRVSQQQGGGLRIQVEAQYLSQGQGTQLRGGSVQLGVEGRIAAETAALLNYSLGNGAHSDPLEPGNLIRPRFNPPGSVRLSLTKRL